MIKCMRNKIAALTCVALVASAVSQPVARAQEASAADGAKPLAVVSVSSYSEWVSDINKIGEIAGKPGLGSMAEAFLTLATGGQGLVGLDKSKSIGAIIPASMQPVVFIPVTDIDQLLGVAKATGAESEKGEDNIYTLTVEDRTYYAKEAAGWAFVTMEKESLATVPANPKNELQGLDEKYDLAVRIFAQNVPQMHKQMAIQQLQAGLASGLERLPDESDEQYELRKKMAENSMQSLVMLVNETDTLTIGWAIDAEKENTYLEFALTAMPDTRMGRTFALYKDGTSNFAGFLDSESAVTMLVSSPAGAKEDIDQGVALLDQVRKRAEQAIEEDSELPDEAAKKIVKASLGDVVTVLQDTLKEGRIDGGMLLKLDESSLTFAGGMQVSDGPKLQGAIKRIAELAQNEPDFPGVKWDADQHGGVNFHSLTVPLPDDAEESARELLGDQVDVILGFGPTSAYLAVGKDGLATVKHVIDKSKAEADKKVQPMQLAVSIGKILKVAAANEDDPKVAMAAEAMQQFAGQDRILVNVTPIPNGVSYRIEVEKGILKGIGKAAQNAQGGGAGGF